MVFHKITKFALLLRTAKKSKQLKQKISIVSCSDPQKTPLTSISST